MTTNRRPGQPVPQPTEPIKRAVSATLRALARSPNCEITFAADKPTLIDVPGAQRARRLRSRDTGAFQTPDGGGDPK